MSLLSNLLRLGLQGKQLINNTSQQCLYHTLNRTNVASNILAPVSSLLLQTAGFKVKGHLRKRCKDCYFVRRQERLFVICETHPRHKQMQMVKDPKNTWILSHATQGKVRAW